MQHHHRYTPSFLRFYRLSNRFPPYQKYSAELLYDPKYPPAFEERRAGLATPDGVIFIHKYGQQGRGDKEFIDNDVVGRPGKTEYERRNNGVVASTLEFGPGDNPPRDVPKFAYSLKHWTSKWRK